MSEIKAYVILLVFALVLMDFITAGIKERKIRKDVGENDDERRP